MKTVERLMKVYIAEDGTEFLKQYQCENYEEDLLKSNQRFEFLNKTILEEMKLVPGLIPYCADYLENQPYWVENNLYIKCDTNRTEIGYLERDDGGVEEVEFDENCPFDMDILNSFKREIEFKYGYTIKMPSYYWSK